MSIRRLFYREADALLIGTNAGEWGGRLLRIPLSTGCVEKAPDMGTPIHDIAPASGKQGCVVLAIGLVHFVPSGSLTELCGSEPRRLYARPWGNMKMKPADAEAGKDSHWSVAVYAFERSA